MPNCKPYANNQPSNTHLLYLAVPESPIHLPFSLHLRLFCSSLFTYRTQHFILIWTQSQSLCPSKPSNGQKYNHFNKTAVNFYIYHCYVWVPLCKNGYAPQSVSCVIVRVNVGAVCEVILHGLWVRWKLCFYGNKCSIVRRSETNTRRIQIRALKGE